MPAETPSASGGMRGPLARLLRLSPSPQLMSSLRGRLAAAAATMAGVAGIVLAGARSSVPFERVVIVAFLLAAPALAIAQLLPSANGAVALIVGAAGAVAINALVAQSMLVADAWSPHWGSVAVGLIATLLCLVPTGTPGAARPPRAETSERGAQWRP
ncbi:hypothetical protein JVX93_05510 [Mycolicibacterium boenickei]|nr:hypothetical protein JVX93_05510 [Mycolicibacterium boenickei]